MIYGPYVDVSFKRNNEYKDERRGFCKLIVEFI